MQAFMLRKPCSRSTASSASCTSAKPTAARILIEIDRCLNRPIIRRARMKRTRIGIAEDIAVPFKHEIRVFFERRFDSPRNSSSLGASYSYVIEVFLT